MLSSGIGFEEDTEFARFASAAFEQAEIAFENTFGTLEETPGIGGFGPETDGEVPEGASLEEVSFEQVFQIPLRGTVTSGFGFRENPLTGKSEFHLGHGHCCLGRYAGCGGTVPGRCAGRDIPPGEEIIL